MNQLARFRALNRHHVVILVGLPGDSTHEQLFAEITDSWVRWLIQLGVPGPNITVLGGSQSDKRNATLPASSESISTTLTELQEQLSREDSLWMFFLGHADHDGDHARFHIPGPDLRAVDFADLLANLKCHEQVLWLTMSSSGWFLEPLSKANRIVITATKADAEPNETEFPLALLEAMERPPAELDRDTDRRVTILELFAVTVEIVQKRYEADERAMTEHAMLDDNGDGRGMEWREINDLKTRIQNADDIEAARLNRRLDGKVAGQTVLRITPADGNVEAEVAVDPEFETN